VDSRDEVSDSDDTQVYIEEPQLIPNIQIDKRDANSDDLDGVI